MNNYDKIKLAWRKVIIATRRYNVAGVNSKAQYPFLALMVARDKYHQAWVEYNAMKKGVLS